MSFEEESMDDCCDHCGKETRAYYCMDDYCETICVCEDCSIIHTDGSRYCKAHVLGKFKCPWCKEKYEKGFLESEIYYHECCRIPICPNCWFEKPEYKFSCPCQSGKSDHKIEVKHYHKGAWYIIYEWCICYKKYQEEEKDQEIMRLRSEKRDLIELLHKNNISTPY